MKHLVAVEVLKFTLLVWQPQYCLEKHCPRQSKLNQFKAPQIHFREACNDLVKQMYRFKLIYENVQSRQAVANQRAIFDLCKLYVVLITIRISQMKYLILADSLFETPNVEIISPVWFVQPDSLIKNSPRWNILFQSNDMTSQLSCWILMCCC